MDLYKILKDHELWLYSDGEEGKRAVLIDANLKGVELEDVNLADAVLKGANLEGAILAEIKNKQILTFSAGKHFAYACDGNIKIGCKTMNTSEWLDAYERIGKQEGYAKQQIKVYGAFIKFISMRV